MKKVFIAALISLTLFACKKDSPAPTPVENRDKFLGNYMGTVYYEDENGNSVPPGSLATNLRVSKDQVSNPQVNIVVSATGSSDVSYPGTTDGNDIYAQKQISSNGYLYNSLMQYTLSNDTLYYGGFSAQTSIATGDTISKKYAYGYFKRQ